MKKWEIIERNKLEKMIERDIDQSTQIGNLKNDIMKLKFEKGNLENLNRTLEDRNKELQSNNEYLQKRQDVLLDWIKKIINDVGCYEVKDTKGFAIPIFKEVGMKKGLSDNTTIIKEKTVIPEITFIEMK